ncbi:small subunit ribosomal protein S17 [Parelusimicrobium proximum]|uniref:30S ribosomal protein S17 n=1 Tax=Parelusimicrobium proximum TaxID=3228953 RepID=UPI003D185D8D
MENTRGQRKNLTGVVVSDKGQKTCVVEVTRTIKHKSYGKVLKRAAKYHAHDEGNEAKIGDKVEITSTRPLSKLKRWRVSKVVEKAVN